MATYPNVRYPKAISRRGGCKVSWMTFDTLKKAEAASKCALVEARYLERLGYDWGYCAPGSITKTAEGHYEVCIP